MSEKISNIAKNTSYYTIALIMQKVISFTYFTLIARALVPDDLGRYYFAVSFTAIFGVLIDIGLTNLLTREVARPTDDESEKKDRATKMLGSVITIKLPLALLSLLFLFIFVNIKGYPVLTRELIYLSSICMILDSFTATLFAVSRGFHNLFYESISSILFQLVVLVTGLVVLHFNLGLLWLMVALVLASTFNIIYSSVLVSSKMKIKMRLNLDFIQLKSVVAVSVPFALFGIYQRLYTYLDSVLLTELAGERYNGLYQVAFKIIFAIQFLPAAFTATIYPAFSSYWLKNKEQIGITFERAINYLVIVSLPISIGTIAIADKIVLVFKSQYVEATLPLQISMASLLFIFINFPIGSLLNACDKQKKNTKNMAIVLTVSIMLNLLLIPKFNAVGASITVLVTNILMFILGMRYVPEIIDLRYKVIGKFFAKVFFASLIMGLLVVYLKNYVNILTAVAVAGCVYIIMLFVMKAVKREDVESIFKSFKRT